MAMKISADQRQLHHVDDAEHRAFEQLPHHHGNRREQHHEDENGGGGEAEGPAPRARGCWDRPTGYWVQKLRDVFSYFAASAFIMS